MITLALVFLYAKNPALEQLYNPLDAALSTQ